MLHEHNSYQEAVVGASPKITAEAGSYGSNIQGVIDYGQYQWDPSQYNPNRYPPKLPDTSEVTVVEREYDEQGRVVKETRTTTRPQRMGSPWWGGGSTYPQVSYTA